MAPGARSHTELVAEFVLKLVADIMPELFPRLLSELPDQRPLPITRFLRCYQVILERIETARESVLTRRAGETARC